MDCSLSTWPSITQFDDFSWMKLGDIDPLESLDRTLDHVSELNGDSPESKAPLSSNTMPSNTSPDFYNSLSPCDSVVAGRWDSINSLDLATVLDSAFPPVDNSSNSSALDAFDLYDADNLMQRGPQKGDGHADVFMNDTPLVLAEVNAATLVPDGEQSQRVALPTPGSSSFSNIEDVNYPSDAGPSASTKRARVDASLLKGHGCKVEVPTAYDSEGTPSVISRHSFKSLRFGDGDLPGHASLSNLSQSPLDVKGIVPSSQHKYIAHGTTLQWPHPNISSIMISTLNGEKVVQHSFPVQTACPATYERQMDFSNAANVSSELKCSRAEASRARRRAATQRRARKYPLQKLIRMSSLPSSAREKLDENGVSSASAVQSQQSTVSRNQISSGAQSLASTVNRQMPTYLPIIHQVPHLTPHANCVNGGPLDCYQQQLSMSPDEGNHLSSGSSAMQPMCMEHSMASVSTIHSLPLSHPAMSTSTMPLDEALLEQLQSVLNKMSVEMRLGIRDALYRLARNAKQRQNKDEVPSGSDASASQPEVVETHTNSIDRWIINILFCKQPNMEASNTSDLSQQWDSRGSSINVQKTTLYGVTGL